MDLSVLFTFVGLCTLKPVFFFTEASDIRLSACLIVLLEVIMVLGDKEQKVLCLKTKEDVFTQIFMAQIELIL